jgi:hypothetical protein
MPWLDPEGMVECLEGIGWPAEVDEGEAAGEPGTGMPGFDPEEPVEGLEGRVGPVEREEGKAL